MVFKPIEEPPDERKAKEAEKRKRISENREIAKREQAADKAERKRKDTRTWTIVESRETFTATFLYRVGGKIKVKKVSLDDDDNDQILIIKIEDLCEKDQKWIKNRGKER